MRTDPYRAGTSIPVLMWVALGVTLLLVLSRVPHVLVWLTVPQLKPVAVTESRAVPIEGMVYTFQSLQLKLPEECAETASVESEKLGPVLNLKGCHPELRIFNVSKDDHLMPPDGEILKGESALERRRSFYAAPSRSLSWWMSYHDLRNYRREIGLISLMRSPGLRRVHIVTAHGITVFVERHATFAEILLWNDAEQNGLRFMAGGLGINLPDAEIVEFASRLQMATPK